MVSCLWLICQFFWWYFTYVWDTDGKIAQVKHFVKGDPFETTARALCQSVRETLAKQVVKYTKAFPCLNEKTGIPSTSTCSEAIAVPKPTIYDTRPNTYLLLHARKRSMARTPLDGLKPNQLKGRPDGAVTLDLKSQQTVYFSMWATLGVLGISFFNLRYSSAQNLSFCLKTQPLPVNAFH